MTTYVFACDEVDRFKESASGARWYLPGADVQDLKGTLAVQRLQHPFFTPRLTPRFAIEAEDHIFAIGSCFARGVEGALAGRGFVVESMTDVFDQDEPRSPGMAPIGFTSKDSTASMLNELSWALRPGTDFPWSALVPHAEQEWVDPHAGRALRFAGRQRTIQRRKLLLDLMRRVRHCRVVVLTLGLAEAWYDNETGHYLNMTPTSGMRKARPGRYNFHVMDYSQTMADLEEIHRLLSAGGHPEVKIVVTVSPVPLMATFSGRDVVIANTHSKSLLRAAAEAWSAAHANVQYFPSYEIVMNSDPARTWAEDGRHLQGPVSRHVMEFFVKHFVKP